MIPVRLTIQGLYSYQGEQTIDFTRLTAAHLFGIFGTVGSGKSSILEAITFALYGKTDRLNLSGDNRNYNMMNLKSDELLIDFVFETGHEQTAYRAIVRGKRNSRRYEDVKTLDRTAYRKDAGQWIPIEQDSLEKAIGLSYDNFKRTIIIPQGQFQEFLQLGNKDRTQMMKELFNLGKYEFFYKVTSLEGKNTAEKQRVEGRLLQLGTVDPEQVGVYEKQLEQTRFAVNELSNRLVACRKTEEQFRQISELVAKLAESEKTLAGLKVQEPDYQARAERLSNYEMCINRFKPLFDSIRTLTEKQAERQKHIMEDETSLVGEEQAIADLNSWLETHKSAYENREQSKRKAEELDALVRIRSLADMILQESEQLGKVQVDLNDLIQNQEKLKTQREQLETSIKTARGELPDMSVLSEIRAWYVEKQGIDRQRATIDTAFRQWKSEMNQFSLEIQDRLKDPVFGDFVSPMIPPMISQTASSMVPPTASSTVPSTALSDDSDKDLDVNPDIEEQTIQLIRTILSEALNYLHQKTDALRGEQAGIEEHASDVRVKIQLAQYADSLEEGAPCPLCGSVHHPVLFKTDDLRTAQETIDEKRRQCEERLAQIRLLEDFFNGSVIRLKSAVQRREALLQQYVEQQAIQAGHEDRFVWSAYREEAQLTKAFEEARKKQQAIAENETALEKINSVFSRFEMRKEQQQLAVTGLQQRITKFTTEQSTLTEQLKHIRPDDYAGIDTAAIAKEKNRFLEEIRQLENGYTDRSEELAVRTKSKSTIEGELNALRKEQEQDAVALGRTKNQLAEQIAKSSFRSEEEIAGILSVPLDTVAEKEQLARYKEALFSSSQQVEQLKKEQGDRVYDPEAHRKLLVVIQGLGEQISQMNQEIGTVQKGLEELVRKLKDRIALEKELEQLDLRAENIKTLKSLFKASGFVNYISTVYLQNLCNAANERFFQLTRQKLRLEMTADNNFEVRDFMNGGKTRSVKTLSGGQTFQAALSLALALADNIQQITKSNQNFFFLDEGFGSLDKESLAIVFDTLKSLRKENRIVGVISHVEEMQQEIDVHLRIENDEERGSLIYPSWLE